MGDFNRGCRLFRKGGLRVEASNSAGENFRQNLISIRSEIRSALAVALPELSVEVTVGS